MLQHTPLFSISSSFLLLCAFFFNDTPPPEIYTLSLHDALPISVQHYSHACGHAWGGAHPGHDAFVSSQATFAHPRSEEHTSELQSRENLVCRLLLEKKKIHKNQHTNMI